jgi:hypothetical protein
MRMMTRVRMSLRPLLKLNKAQYWCPVEIFMIHASCDVDPKHSPRSAMPVRVSRAGAKLGFGFACGNRGNSR